MMRKIFALSLAILGLMLKSCVPDSLKKGYYIQDKQVVLYHGFPASRQVIAQADPETFKSINTEYGKDKTQVFYYGKLILNAGPATFEYLGGAFSNLRQRQKSHLL